MKGEAAMGMCYCEGQVLGCTRFTLRGEGVCSLSLWGEGGRAGARNLSWGRLRGVFHYRMWRPPENSTTLAQRSGSALREEAISVSV